MSEKNATPRYEHLEIELAPELSALIDLLCIVAVTDHKEQYKTIADERPQT